MSGFTGIIHLDGQAVEPVALERMTHLAERHGGDQFKVWCKSNAGFGHSLLRSTAESAHEVQPFSFNGRHWIVGDARVDERELLVAQLQAQDRQARLSQPDIELILHAFHVWGDDCVEHFFGDFAWVIWDQHQQRVFCARDSFGVKPFYYAYSGITFVFSNNLNSVRACPGIADELNSAVLCDFFTFGFNLDERTSIFRDIARLPPAHTLTLGRSGAPKTRKYQRLVFTERLLYSDPHDYQEHFLELFKQAIKDRLRTNKVGFELSGGLDSTAVASVTALLNRDNEYFCATAVTTDCSSTLPQDREAFYARMVTKQLGLQHEFITGGMKKDFFSYCDTSQPYSWPFAATSLRFASVIRKHAKVMLSGQGGDPFLQASGYQLLDAYRESSLPALSRRLFKKILAQKTVRGHGLRGLFAGDAPRSPLPEIPAWIKAHTLEQSGSEQRWRELYYRPHRYPRGCTAELAYDGVIMPDWTSMFEDYYHDMFNGIDCRHPLVDIRLVNFFFALPASMKKDKAVLRESLHGTLPEAVRTRPKSPLTGDMVRPVLAESACFAKLTLANCRDWIDEERYLKALRRYARGDGGDRFVITAPLCLENWINN